jgi:hypothetical protein
MSDELKARNFSEELMATENGFEAGIVTGIRCVLSMLETFYPDNPLCQLLPGEIPNIIATMRKEGTTEMLRDSIAEARRKTDD